MTGWIVTFILTPFLTAINEVFILAKVPEF